MLLACAHRPPVRQESFVNDEMTLAAFLLALSGSPKHVDTIMRGFEAGMSRTQDVGTLTDDHLDLLC